jgi:hypothetical protein
MSGWYESRPNDYDKYKRKVTHIFQGSVRDDGGAETTENKPVSILRRFHFNSNIQKYIKNPEILKKFPILPIDFEKGRDLEIGTSQNQH